MDIADYLRKSVVHHFDRPAVSFRDWEQSYRDLWQRACRLANGLAALGLRPGDRVGTLGDNGPESLEVIAGLAVGGFVRCPLYAQNVPDTHLYMLKLVGAKALIVQDRYCAELGASVHQAGLDHTIVVGNPFEGCVSYDALLEDVSEDDPAVVIHPDDPHIIRFSAGTTGRPKGILHSVAGWTAMGNEFALALPGIHGNDSYLVAGPLSHAAGLLVWPMIASGACQVVLPSFDVQDFLEAVRDKRCTLTFLVPTMIQMIVNCPAASHFDLSSLRAVFYGGAPASEQTLREARAMWGDIMYQLYGQSECPPVTVLTPAQHGFESSTRPPNLRSAGRATPNSSITIRDEQGARLPTGSTGEVCVRSPAQMKGIWDDPAATFERLTTDGALRTRDVGYLDEEGFLFLADRKEDLIISGGFNIWPAEVENALCSHPAVREAAVVGVPHAKWGETAFAVVVLHPEASATEKELIAWCRKEVGPVKKPTSVLISDEPLPKSPVGKLLRRSVRARFWRNEGREIHGA